MRKHRVSRGPMGSSGPNQTQCYRLWRQASFRPQVSYPRSSKDYHPAPLSSLLSGWVHGEVNDVSKGREGPTEEGGCHVFPIHIESVPLPRGPAFRERVRPYRTEISNET